MITKSFCRNEQTSGWHAFGLAATLRQIEWSQKTGGNNAFAGTIFCGGLIHIQCSGEYLAAARCVWYWVSYSSTVVSPACCSQAVIDYWSDSVWHRQWRKSLRPAGRTFHTKQIDVRASTSSGRDQNTSTWNQLTTQQGDDRDLTTLMVSLPVRCCSEHPPVGLWVTPTNCTDHQTWTLTPAGRRPTPPAEAWTAPWSGSRSLCTQTHTLV